MPKVKTVIPGDLWYHRITFRQQTELIAALGPCEGVHYKDIIGRIEMMPEDALNKQRLLEIVTVAAERAGCTGKDPLVDAALADHMRTNRPKYH